MNARSLAGWTCALCLVALLTCCAKAEDAPKAKNEGSTAEQAAEIENTDLAVDSEREEPAQEESKASTDLFEEEGALCTQYLRLAIPEAWPGNVTYHYFHDPDAGRYALDIVENESMAATEGTGGRVFSIVVTQDDPNENDKNDKKSKKEKGDYDYLGILSGEEEQKLYVLIEYPGGTQYTEGSEESYRRILDTAGEIAGNLEGRGGYTFEAGEDPEETEE